MCKRSFHKLLHNTFDFANPVNSHLRSTDLQCIPLQLFASLFEVEVEVEVEVGLVVWVTYGYDYSEVVGRLSFVDLKTSDQFGWEGICQHQLSMGAAQWELLGQF